MYELAEHLTSKIGFDYSKKKNRVIFLKAERLLKVLGIKEWKNRICVFSIPGM